MATRTQFKKGHKKLGGRAKGVANKITRGQKELTLKFADGLHKAYANMGGVQHLTKWARKHPTEFYKIFARTLPLEVTGSLVPPIIEVVQFTQIMQVDSKLLGHATTSQQLEAPRLPAAPLELPGARGT